MANNNSNKTLLGNAVWVENANVYFEKNVTERTIGAPKSKKVTSNYVETKSHSWREHRKQELFRFIKLPQQFLSDGKSLL